MADNLNLSILNPRPTKLPGPELLHDLIAKPAGDSGDSATAIEFCTPDGNFELLSYQELQCRTERLSNKLHALWKQARSTGPFVVPLYIQQCPSLYVAQIAVLKAGGAFCPIPLDCPEDRLKFILRDVEASLLLTSRELSNGLPTLDGISVVLVAEGEEGDDVEPSSLDIAPSQPAYVMYTSGSTGLPKGVKLSHSAATQALLAHDRHIPPFSRFLQFASPTFDVSVFEIFFPLFRGATLVCCDRRQLLTDLPGCINRLEIDAAELTPSVASSLLHGRKSVPSLKLLLTIGEMLKRDVIEEFGGSAEQHSILYGMYGPTEATIHCTVQTKFMTDMPSGTIGEPFDTVSVFVLRMHEDSNAKETSVEILPLGEEGELTVGGFQLADGYINREEQTRAAFVSHPEYGRLYRTGDRVRLLPDGKLECLGRISSGQVKLRGQRIELGEIEHAASKADGCRSVVAEVINSTLVVFCVCEDASVSRQGIRETCRKWLPTFMIPGDIVVLDALPYLSSGKVDRKTLQSQYRDRQKAEAPAEADVSDRLQAIMKCVSNILGVQMLPQTELSSAGLDSLSCIRLASELGKQGFAKPDATTLIEARTVREIDAMLHHANDTKSTDEALRAFKKTCESLRQAVNRHRLAADYADEIESIFPATPTQSAMLAETARDPQAYCNWTELWVDQDVSRDDIALAIERLAHIHSLLRSGFVAAEDSNATHAVIVWHRLSPIQLMAREHFEHDFQIETEYELLRPCSFQVMGADGGIRILLRIHHALYDQWSMDILRVDLFKLLAGDKYPSPLRFEDVSAFQASQITPEKRQNSKEFWQDHFRDFTPKNFPLMLGQRLPPEQQRTEWRSFHLDMQSLRNRSRQTGFGIPSFFQAALTWILGCYVGEPDVSFGVVFSGRHIPVPGVDKVFGPCLATLPLRVDPSTARTCTDLVRLIHHQNRQLQRHHLTPLYEIRGQTQVSPGVPLFDTLFIWQQSTVVDGLSIQEVASRDQHEFKLVLEFEPLEDRVRGRCTYQQSCVSMEQVDLLLQQLCTLVEHMVEEPESLVQNLASCFHEDALLSISNPAPSSGITDRSLVGAIQSHAREIPDAPAITFASAIKGDHASCQTITYGDFNARANRLARFLQSQGIVPEDVVCVCMEKSIDFYVAALATIKVGANYLPLVPDTPAARIKSIFTQASVRACLCDRSSSEIFQKFEDLILVDVVEAIVDSFEPLNLPFRRSGPDVFYTIFTSGSTGEPKGVAVTTDNILGNVQVLSELYQVKPGDRLLQACSQAFDVSVFEIFFTLYTGICLCSATKNVLFQDFEASIRALEITHLSLTPTVASLVEPTNTLDVRFLVTAGEGVTDLVHRRWSRHGLHQGYGPSETTNICTVNMNMSPHDVLGNIGRPFRNTSAFVVSPGASTTILPAGSLGEFVFGGEQVFRGYLGREDLNGQKLLDDPRFGRLYKSGDVGRILPDGTLLISGRIDDQVKIRGNRVELGEINAILMNDREVTDCTTLVLDDNQFGQSLVSFAVARGVDEDKSNTARVLQDQKAFLTRLFEALEASLPSYMVPTAIVPLSCVPKTSSGKLDKRLLRSLFVDLENPDRDQLFRHNDKSDEAEEWTQQERSLANALADVLRVAPTSIGKTHSFFSYGLNSLNAIAFARNASERLAVLLTVSSVLQNPSLARLARVSLSTSGTVSDSEVSCTTAYFAADAIEEIQSSVQVSPEMIETILPCTPLQTAMLSAGNFNSNSAYANSTVFSVSGDVNRLKQCWQTMVERHSILRTCFVRTTSAAHPFAQVTFKALDLPWVPRKSTSNGSINGAYATSQGDQLVDLSRPFQIEEQSSSEGTKLILHMHHAIYDGMSMDLLLGEVESAYRGSKLPAPVSFAPFVAQVEKQRQEDTRGFWREHLLSFQPLQFPKLSEPVSSAELSLQTTLPLKPEELGFFCKRHALSQLAVYQSAIFKILQCSQDATDLCIGNVVSGRSVPLEGIDRLIAPCFNTLPVRMDIGRVRNNLDLVQQTHRLNVSMVNYQLTPLRSLQMLSKSPSMHLFDCVLILQPPQESRDAEVWTMEEEHGDMDLPLVFEIVPNGTEIRLTLHHILSMVSEQLAESFAEAFAAALHDILRYPSGDATKLDDFASDRILGSLKNYAKVRSGVDGTDMTEETDRNENESFVREVFSRLSTVELSRITRTTSMYQIGLDSLNAAQVAARLDEAGFAIDAADVMENLTPAAIADVAARKKKTATRKQVTSIDLEEFDRVHRSDARRLLRVSVQVIEAVRPCTPVQCGMIAQSMSSEGRLYVNHVTYCLPESIDGNALKEAWKHVQKKHQVLRMGFVKIADTKVPFAMVIFTPGYATVPSEGLDEDMDRETVDLHARAAVIDDLRLHPWRVSLQVRERRVLMTLSIHHALYDAEGLNILLADLQSALEQQSLSAPTNLDPLLQVSLAATTNDETKGAQFWQESLREASVSRFPDLSPTRTQYHGLQSDEIQCSEPLDSIESFCRNQNASIQALGQTAWALLLSAYLGDSKVTFGTVFSGKPTSGAQDVVFPSITTIPVPCDTQQDHMKLLQSMVQFNAASKRYRFTPLADIQRFAGNASSPLFDTMFAYQKVLVPRDVGTEWDLIRETSAVDYAVSLELETFGDALHVRLTYDTDRVPRKQAQIILQQYNHILSRITHGNTDENHNDPSIYSIQPAKEESLPSKVKFLDEFLEFSALSQPDRVALKFVYSLSGSEPLIKTWTYRQLNERANQVAHLIQQHGVPAGSVIALSMGKSPEATFAFAGILKAGCSFLAMDPDLPESRINFIVEDSNTRLVFVDQDRSVKFASDKAVLIDLSENKLECLPSTAVDRGITSVLSPCYCLYTSGTTGTPKGCVITHENAVQAMLSFQRLFAGHWTDESQWLQFASYWFDVSVLEQFWSWSVGIAVVGAPRDVVLEDLPGFISRINITHIDLTPSLARLLDPDDVPSLWNGVFITGGEALKQEIIDKWGAKKAICNGYGPTEATIGVTMNTFIDTEAKPLNIGPQFDNVGSYVLSPHSNEPVMRGAIGELCVSGKLVGQGYLNRPDQTSKSFPTLQRFGEKVYRTGDLVRLLADGSFSFLGRMDTQTKLRGQRLEIGEIDKVIQESTEENAEVVTLVVKSEGKETLVSFIAVGAYTKGEQLEIVPLESARSIAGRAKDFCTDHLPGYMVPTHVLPIKFLPLTVNNKVDAKRLTALFNEASQKDLHQLQNSDQDSRPLDPTESKIALIMAEMLDINGSTVGSRSNLFSLGMSSISAITFSGMLKHNGFRNASVATIMKNPTLNKLAASLSDSSSSGFAEQRAVQQAKLRLRTFAKRHRHLAAKLLGVDVREIETVAPCLPLQQGIIVDSFKNAGDKYFNEFHFSSNDVNSKALQRAFNELAKYVEILRARFIDTDNGYAQVILQHVDIRFEEHTVESNNKWDFYSRNKSSWVSRNEKALVEPFQVVLVHFDACSILVLRMHHAIYDGISMDLMMEKLTEIYAVGHANNYGPSFIDAMAFGPLDQPSDAKAFWTERLDGHHFSSLPLAGREPSPHGCASIVTARINDTAVFEVQRKKLSVSHQALMQACFETALLNIFPDSRQYGMVVSGRSIEVENADRIIGPMFNTLVQPIQIASDSTWADHARNCHDLNTAVLHYQHTSLRDIRKWCGAGSSDPMFDVLFVFHYKASEGLNARTRPWEPIDDELQAGYPLAFEIEYAEEGYMNVNLIAKRHIVDTDDLRDLLQHFKDGLQNVVHKSNTMIAASFPAIADLPKVNRQNANSMQDMNGVLGFEWTEEAEAIRQILSQIAGVDLNDVDEHSSIFTLGLDSIDAVRLASRFRKAGFALSVSQILKAQTIPRMLWSSHSDQQTTVPLKDFKYKSLCQELNKLMSEDSHLRGLDLERVIPATPNQEAILADMIRSELHQYFNHDVLCLSSDVDIERLKNAWQTVVDSNSILRTSFVEVSNPEIEVTFAQAVHAAAEVRFTQLELENLDNIDHVLDDIREDVLKKLSRVPPLRLTLARAKSAIYLVLSLSHAQYDGHSLALLHEDVQKAYLENNTPRPSYNRIVEQSIGAINNDSRDFWSGLLAGAEIKRIVFDETISGTATTIRAERLSSVNGVQARSFCQEHGISMQTLAQTCWSLYLATQVRSLDVLFGVVLACREDEESEQVMFPTMNTVVMRASLHGSRKEMLQYMQSTMTDIIPHQRTPLRVIQAAAAKVIERDEFNVSGGLFDSLFIYQHRPSQGRESKHQLYESVRGSSSVEYPIAAEMEIAGDELIMRTACKTNLLSDTTPEEVLKHLEDVLLAILKAPNDSTVDFHETGVSVCGLPAFEVQDSNYHHIADEVYSSDAQPIQENNLPQLSTIISVLAQVSGAATDDVLPTSSMESIGIDSISAIKVASLLRKQGINISVSQMIRSRNPLKMAAAVADNSTAADPMQIASTKLIADMMEQKNLINITTSRIVDPTIVECVLPATAGQLYFLSLWKRTDGQLFYPEFVYKLEAGVETSQISKAWDALRSKHRVLRTVFATTGDSSVPLTQVVLKPNSGADQETKQTEQPFVYLRTEAVKGGHILYLKIHHALYDAVSLPMLMHELQSLLAGQQDPHPALQFEDFIASSITPASAQHREAFWKQYLHNTKPRNLRQPKLSGLQKKVNIFTPSLFTKYSQLESFLRREGLSMQDLLFATFAKLYAELATAESYDHEKEKQTSDIIFGIYLSNRSHLTDLDRLAAPTLNLIPLHIRLPSQTPILELARKIQDDLRAIGSPDNSAVSLAEIAQWTGVEVDAFVNFLRLPDESETDNREPDESSVRLAAMDDERLKERAEVVEVESKGDFTVPSELEGLESIKGYKHAIDIEMTVRHDRLDVGLFAPEAMLGLDRAQHTLKDLEQMLEDLVQGR